MPAAGRSLPALVVLALLCAAAAGCSTDPVNPDGCRAIEEVRCEAAFYCPNFPGYPAFDVTACKRFYRDQCLHGLASEADPGEPRIEQCVKAIQTAKNCAVRGTSPCAIGAATTVTTACDVVEHPETYPECAFLVPPPVAADAATAADAGTQADAQSN
jgi:hypothetical protein